MTVSSYLEAWDRRGTFPSYSGYMGELINYCLDSTHSLSILIHGSGGYVLGNVTAFNTNGNDLVRNSGGNAIVVAIQYRLGVFGFLPGQKMKDGGVLNAGLCKHCRNYIC